jgi:nicotinamidase-related amidase
VFTRFIPPARPDELPVLGNGIFTVTKMTLDRIDRRLLDLILSLARFVPPAAVVDKHFYSPFVEGELLELLRSRRVDTLVITGAETDVCVLAAVLGVVDFGYQIVLADDALCSSSDMTHDALLTLYRERFSYQIEATETCIILSNWPETYPLPCRGEKKRASPLCACGRSQHRAAPETTVMLVALWAGGTGGTRQRFTEERDCTQEKI